MVEMNTIQVQSSRGAQLMKRAIAPIALLGLSLGSTAAFAIPCQEVANMLNAGVPANIVASAVRDSGAQYTASDIACLSKAGAPASSSPSLAA